ncbi:hypothetical protein ATANTOWER_010627 [Ataeniobius toweri]|uniref:Zinc finger DNA-directed DNA polymerase family B alpha domain-containing protein n=1 Tax=Ataeniobius toweri TaxID=208326 RepID=A0ABU7BBH1_9TELE|nr:hypothetical protein [Ataeniobius toweri]
MTASLFSSPIYHYVFESILFSRPRQIEIRITNPRSRRPDLRQHVQYSEKALYNQLCFYRYIFDWDYAVAKVLQTAERNFVKKLNGVKEAYRKLKEVPDKALATSGYSEVNLAKLFQASASLK